MAKTPSTRARPFRATREHHNLEAAEDYTELVLDLIESKGTARTVDIAECLGISHVTALRTIRRLQDEGFMNTSRGKPITLTPKGKKLAVYARERHEMLVEFFVALGIPRKVAEVDVEGAEHHISETSLKKIARFMKEKDSSEGASSS